MQWSELAPHAAVVLASAAISALLTWLAILYARARGMLDAPGARRSHEAPTPRGGGIAIAFVCLLACVMAGIRTDAPAQWACIGAGLLLVALAGWWDDHRPLPAWPRLFAHVVAAGLLAAGLWLGGATPAACLAVFVLAVVLVNAWNFIDGINGLAASQALLCAGGLALWLGASEQPLALALALALVGACLGFLPFNFPKARIFLGDVGSGSLGYTVAVLMGLGFEAAPLSSWPLLLLPPMAILADTGLTLVWRLHRGERWWEAHVHHTFQYWARQRGHLVPTLGYGLWTLLALGFMLAQRNATSGLVVVGVLAWSVASCLAWRYLRRGMESATEGFGA